MFSVFSRFTARLVTGALSILGVAGLGTVLSVAPVAQAAAPQANVGERVAWSAAQGNPDFTPGHGLGYYFWHDSAGVHLRTTTEGRRHVFTGVIQTGPFGFFRNVSGFELEKDDTFTASDHRIQFRFNTFNGADGLNFNWVGGNDLTLVLNNDGRSNPTIVHFGSTGQTATALPLTFVVEADPGLLPWSETAGRPDFTPGHRLGYYIWHDSAGVHLRATTEGRIHRFSGIIRLNAGASFSNVVLVQPEKDDHFQLVAPNVLAFSFLTASGIDGLDFQISGAGRAIGFGLQNDGHSAIGVVHLGATQQGITTDPFRFDLDR